MTRGPLKFKETDVKRLVKSAKEAGLEVAKVEVTSAGGIVVHTEKSEDETVNPWEKRLGKK
jgi:hypothetical protein